MNKSERNVVTLLEKNCRLPANQIAKKVRLSPEGVLKIIKRLETTGVITTFNTKINYSRMGYKLFPVYIKLLRLNSTIINQLHTLISKHKTCAWHMFCEGEYDLLLSFKVMSDKDTLDMNEMIREISDNILEKELAMVLHATEISKSLITDKNSNKSFPIFNHDVEKVTLSDEEIKLINILRTDSREKVVSLSKKMNVSPRIIASKIKKLQQSKVISGFKTKINMSALNYQPCMALISFSKYSGQELQRFTTYCHQKKGIHYFVRQIGKYDIALTIDVSNINEFYALIDEIREQFSFVKKITTLISKQNNGGQ